MTDQEPTELEREITDAWEALFRLRAAGAINPDAAARKHETEERYLRELQRLSLLAVRDA